jgi:hypothetical protein
MIESKPGTRLSYPSIGPERWDGSFQGCSKYYAWFCELNYPMLDVQQWEDGEIALIEFYNSPIIPSMTKWNYVLQGMRHMEISASFFEKYCEMLDLHQKKVWDDAEAKTEKMMEEKRMLDRHAEDTAERAKNVIMQTPTLMERIVKNGLHELNLDNIVKHIPRHQLIGHKAVERRTFSK